MKSKLLFGFAVVATFAAILLSGCGKSSTNTPASNCIDINGNVDTGLHKIYLAGVYGIVPDIRDTLSATVSGSAVTIHSNALQRNLVGTINASDCNKVDIDSLIFVAGDTLKIHSGLHPSDSTVKIYDVRAGGSGTITSTGVTTSIKIKKGHTNLAILPDLSNVELKGTFVKKP